MSIDDALNRARAATERSLTVQSAKPAELAVSVDAAAEVKSQISAKHAELTLARKAAVAEITAAREAVKKQQAELEAQLRALELELAPQVEQMKQMEETIWSINLYLGSKEEISCVTSGEPAPASTPVVVRQGVLFMDEESLLFSESDGFDFRNVDDFAQWLASSTRHVDQVIPEARGVVAIAPRRREKRYGDPWMDASAAAANAHTWFLIRNNENVYLLSAEFEVGSKLVPSRDEFTSMFYRDGVMLEPGSREWIAAEKASGARERHYMRIALLLQGLIDRTAVFSPLPAANISLLSPKSYDDGHVVLLADDDMAIGDGRPAYADWLRAAQMSAHEGSRVAFTPAHSHWPSRSTEARNYGQHERLTPPRASGPQDGVYQLLKGPRAGTFKFMYERTDVIYDGWDIKEPTRRASARIEVGEGCFIPLDVVSIADLDYYLGARSQRQHYAQSINLLRTVRDIKQAEAAAEAPFRQMLIERLITAGSPPAQAADEVCALVDWWKHTNKFQRALTGDAEHEATAAKAILAEHGRRVKSQAALSRNADLAQTLREGHPNALMVARKKDGSWVVLDPQERRHTIHGRWVEYADPFTTMTTYTQTGKLREVTEWHLPRSSSIGRWTVLHTSPEWSSWPRDVSRVDYLDDSQVDDLIARVLTRVENTVLWVDLARVDDRWEGRCYSVDLDSELSAAPNDHSVFNGTRRVLIRDGRFTVSARSDGLYLYDGSLKGPETYLGRLTKEAARGESLMRNEEAIEKLIAKDVELQAAHADNPEKEAAAREVFDGLSTSDHRIMMAEARAEFVKDYAPELWEDHSKSVKVKVRFSDWWGRSHSDEGKVCRVVGLALRWLVDTDLPMTGTVRDIVERAIADGAPIEIPDVESTMWDVPALT